MLTALLIVVLAALIEFGFLLHAWNANYHGRAFLADTEDAIDRATDDSNRLINLITRSRTVIETARSQMAAPEFDAEACRETLLALVDSGHLSDAAIHEALRLPPGLVPNGFAEVDETGTTIIGEIVEVA